MRPIRLQLGTRCLLLSARAGTFTVARADDGGRMNTLVVGARPEGHVDILRVLVFIHGTDVAAQFGGAREVTQRATLMSFLILVELQVHLYLGFVVVLAIVVGEQVPVRVGPAEAVHDDWPQSTTKHDFFHRLLFTLFCVVDRVRAVPIDVAHRMEVHALGLLTLRELVEAAGGAKHDRLFDGTRDLAILARAVVARLTALVAVASRY